MILDWLAREGWIVLNWWLLASLAGLAVFPLLTRLLSGLPDRGFTLARAVGLLMVGFVYWLLATTGFLRNTPGGIVLAWLLVLALSLVVYLRQPFDWRGWWQENRPAIITGEVLFVAMLILFALYRAYNPNLTGTEKPMELAFMSAVQRSELFPPNDPWLSGYAISYYYFGYVQEAMLSMLSGISSTVGFNMMISLLFALTGLTSFGVVYNLVRSRVNLARVRSAVLTGLLGALFVTVLGNFQTPLIEIPYQTGAASQSYLDFWGQVERLTPKASADEFNSITTSVENWDHWWWFRASRVIADRDLNGALIGVQPIDEFPSFSFVLSDVHPHVLALPFAVLALGLALHIVLRGRAPDLPETVFYGLIAGGLVFLNIWDAPYIAFLVGAEALRRLIYRGSGRLDWSDWLALLRFGLSLIGLTFLFYLPFFLSFRSQASGIVPNLIYATDFPQYFVMYGPFLIILALYLLLELRLGGDRVNWRLGLSVVAGLVFGVLLFMLAGLVLAAVNPATSNFIAGYVAENGGIGAAVPLVLARRLETLPMTLLLLLAVLEIVSHLFPRIPPVSELVDAPLETRRIVNYSPATGFALLLIGGGVMLTLLPEYMFLRDNFGVRINTVFKFYYQAWLMFALASAYGVYVIVADARLKLRWRAARLGMSAVALVAVVMGLSYPLLAYHNRAFVESGRLTAPEPVPLTLHGGSTLVLPEDYQAITCLGQLVQGDDAVVVEALGPAYNSGYGRVGALTGIPIVLGWENHEGQWRGSTYSRVVANRPNDIRQLYTDLRWDVAQEIIQRYGIDYIFYGISERAQYGSQGETKFADNLPVVCERGSSRFYRVTAASLALGR